GTAGRHNSTPGYSSGNQWLRSGSDPSNRKRWRAVPGRVRSRGARRRRVRCATVESHETGFYASASTVSTELSYVESQPPRTRDPEPTIWFSDASEKVSEMTLVAPFHLLRSPCPVI